MADPTPRALQLVAAERARDARVVDLARLLSIAVQIEPELVRAMRLTVLPSVDAGVESDLWFSPLVAARDPEGMSFLPDVAELLRKELAEPAHERARVKARTVIASVHAGHSPMLVLEEAATYFCVSSEDRAYAQMEREIGRAVAALETSSDDVIARWAVRALPRMPEAVRASEAAMALARRAAKRLGGIKVRGIIEAGEPGADWDAQLLTRLPKLAVGVRLTSAGLEITHPPSSSSARTIEVPHTDPFVLEVATPTPNGWQPRRVTLKPDTSTTAELSVGPLVRVTTATGDMQTFRVDTLGRAPVLYAPGTTDFSSTIVQHANELGWHVVWKIADVEVRNGTAVVDALVVGPKVTDDDLFNQGRQVELAAHTAHAYGILPEGLVRYEIPAVVSHFSSDKFVALVDRDRLAKDLRSALIEIDTTRTRRWIDGAVVPTQAPELPRRDFADAPYPGLRPFRTDEGPIFFGRTREVEEMRDILLRTHRLMVSGSSGAGRASLLRAGLMAALRDHRSASDGVRWEFLDLLPRGDFIEEARRKVASLTPDTNLLILIDQFEEVFRLHNRSDVQKLVEFLRELRTRDARNLYLVISVRADFVNEAFRSEEIAMVSGGSPFVVTPMTRDQMRDAIIGPARLAGSAFEPSVIDRLLDDVANRSDALPLLQYLLKRLWTAARQRSPDVRLVTMEVYESIGGARAMNLHAEEVFSELGTEAQRIAEGMFRSLTEGEARRPARMREIAEVTGATLEALSAVVDAFRRDDRSFVAPAEPIPLDAETILDITGALLIGEWERLRGWVRRETQSAQLYQNLRIKAERWREGRPEPWTPEETNNALSWRDEAKPTRAWAERYGGNFETAMAFLEAMQQRPPSDARQRRETFEYEFYVSYAHIDLDDSLKSFIELLGQEVRQRTGDPRRLSFMDTSIRPGERWSEALASALERSAVMVSILSPGYFASEYIAKEVQFFSQLRGGVAGSVIPVLWRPLTDIPRPFADLQLFTHDTPEVYRTRGARALRRQGEELRTVIDMLGDAIVRLAEDARNRPRPPAAVPDFERVESAWPTRESSEPRIEDRDRAVVAIGVGHNSHLPALPAATSAARRVAEWAKASQRIPERNVLLLTDDSHAVGASEVSDAIREFVSTGGLKQLVIYFAGYSINAGRSERWLLTQAPMDTTAAIDVESSILLARDAGIPHVVFISDTCRVAAASINAVSVQGSQVFPAQTAAPSPSPVDVFRSSIVGSPAHEPSNADLEASKFQAAYTERLISALSGEAPDVQDGPAGLSVVTPRALKNYLQRSFEHLGATMPDARIESGPEAWLARFPRQRADSDYA